MEIGEKSPKNRNKFGCPSRFWHRAVSTGPRPRRQGQEDCKVDFVGWVSGSETHRDRPRRSPRWVSLPLTHPTRQTAEPTLQSSCRQGPRSGGAPERPTDPGTRPRGDREPPRTRAFDARVSLGNPTPAIALLVCLFKTSAFGIPPPRPIRDRKLGQLSRETEIRETRKSHEDGIQARARTRPIASTPGIQTQWSDRPGIQTQRSDRPGIQTQRSDRPGIQTQRSDRPGIQTQ